MEPTSKPRIGFVGAGRHSTANLYPSFASSGVPIAAVAERNPKRAAEVVARGNARAVFSDHRELLANVELDGVVVSLAPELQPDVVADCLRARVPVFVEKPLGSNASVARRFAALSAELGVPVMLGFMKRFAPAYVRLAGMLGGSAALGEPRTYSCVFGFSPWKPDLSDREFITQAAVHLIDLVRSLFGEVTAVTGMRSASDGLLSIAVTVRHAGGVVGSLNLVSSASWARETEELTVTADHGLARVYDLSRIEVREPAPGARSERPWEDLLERASILESSNSPASGGLRDLFLRGYVGELQHFLDVVKGRAVPITSADDNVRTMELCDRILRAVADPD